MDKLQYDGTLAVVALCLWREARGEADEVIYSVANVIMNRAHRDLEKLIGIVTKPWQFSSMTDPKDHQLIVWPKTDDPSWIKCLDIVDKLMKEELENPVGGADHYYDISMKTPPPWADESKFVVKIGRIRFFNLLKDDVA